MAHIKGFLQELGKLLDFLKNSKNLQVAKFPVQVAKFPELDGWDPTQKRYFFLLYNGHTYLNLILHHKEVKYF